MILNSVTQNGSKDRGGASGDLQNKNTRYESKDVTDGRKTHVSKYLPSQLAIDHVAVGASSTNHKRYLPEKSSESHDRGNHHRLELV